MIWVHLHQWLDQCECLFRNALTVDFFQYCEEIFTFDHTLLDRLVVLLELCIHFIDFILDASL